MATQRRRQYFDAPYDARMETDDADDATDEEDDVQVVSGSSDEEYESFVRESLRRRDAGSSKLQSPGAGLLAAAGASKPGRAKATAHSSSEDEFEKEMNAGLDAAVSGLTKVASEAVSLPTTNLASAGVAVLLEGCAASVSGQPLSITLKDGGSTGGKDGSSNRSSGKVEEYNAMYFDSSDEDGDEAPDGGPRRRDQRRMQTDEELLYDPGIDDDNQRWVDEARRRAQGTSTCWAASTSDTGQVAPTTSNRRHAASTSSNTGQVASISSERDQVASTSSSTDRAESTAPKTGQAASTSPKTGQAASTSSNTGQTASTSSDTGQTASTSSDTGQTASTSSDTGQSPSTSSNKGQASSSAGNQRGVGNVSPLGPTDAVLNCPACMSVLTMDCQRHETYTNQYRAMFVFNCHVDTDQVLAFPEPSPTDTTARRGRRKKQKSSNIGPDRSQPPGGGGSSDRKYHPVKCAECGTQVAVYDEDEIYHFFDVLASHA